LREISGFTLIELMAATTVLSVILLMMVGMQDQMSKAWSNSNRRTDATREARAACRLMAQDLSGLVVRRTNNDNATPDSIPAALLTNGVPFLYSSNGLGPAGGTDLIPLGDSQSSASYLFGISSRRASGTNSGDLAIVGYYIASATTTNVNGFTSTTYNLYRHYVPASNAVNNLNAWFASKTPTDLFDPTNAEILARNTCNLRITFYNKRDADGKYAVTNGLNYSCESSGTATYFSGNKIQVEISVYPEDSAQRIPYTDWEKSENIRKFARSYEFRVDVPRN
jgi:prepilin-type N-terminal cleavage/methylation domain-containing protein